MSDTIQLRGGTYAILNARNLVYAEREVVVELDTGRWKVGDGSTGYADLPYKLMDFIGTFFARIDQAAPRYPRVDRDDTVSTNLFVDTDDYDTRILTAQANDFTIRTPTGTPKQGQSLRYRIKDDGNSWAITWYADFRAFDVALPTATVAGKTLYVDFVWNAEDGLWDCQRVLQEA